MVKKLESFIIVIILFSFALCAFQFTERLTPSEERGKLIYTKGVRASGEPITAQLSGAQFDAKILPCSNCHGRTGKGNPEGGVDPSPLDWSSLTKSYAIEFKNGRKRGGYNRSSLKKAIVDGFDPSENELDLVMPRYSLNDGDVDDLISYFKIIDKLDVAGISDSSIHVGVILPALNRYSERPVAMVKTMKAYLDLVNKAGGLYNRKFYLTEIYTEDSPEKTDSVILNFLIKPSVFAFMATDLEILPAASLAALEESEIPVIGAITGNPKKTDYLRNSFYYIFPGLYQEINNLTKFALEHLVSDHDDFVILYDSSASISKVDLDDILMYNSAKIITINSNNPEQLIRINQLKNKGISTCLYLGDARSSLSFLSLIHQIKWYPNILISGKFASTSWFDAPIEMNEKIYFSYPTWITERDEKAMYQYNLMARNYGLTNEHINAQLNCLAATILLTEVMQLSGKEVSQETMIETLHGLKDFESGFISPMSFGPNKRIGSEKVFIVKLDLVNKEPRLVNK